MSSTYRQNVETSSKKEVITNWSEYLHSAKQEFQKRMSGKTKSKTAEEEISDLRFIKTMGQGRFGKVMLVQKQSDGKYFVGKLREKEHIVKYNYVGYVLNEKKLLESLIFPFAIKMDFFFQDNVYLYFLMPFMSGGDLFNLLQKRGKFDEEHSKFYTGQIVLALEYLHYLKLVHRDLKPENILLDREGYVKVSNYRFVKEVPQRTYTFCGAPEYTAPEIIFCNGYCKAIDYWSLGILMYELNTNTTPFYSKQIPKIYEKIVMGKYVFPERFSPELKDIIKHLLQNDSTRRFGNLRRGVLDIKDHIWFKSIDWLALFNKEIKPPIAITEKKVLVKTQEQPLKQRDFDPYHDIFAVF